MFKPNKIITAVAGVAAAGALVASSATAASAAVAAPHAAKGKSAKVRTSDKHHLGTFAYNAKTRTFKVCDGLKRKGFYTYGAIGKRKADKNGHHKIIGHLSANNGCVTGKSKAFKPGTKIVIQVAFLKKGDNKHAYKLSKIKKAVI